MTRSTPRAGAGSRNGSRLHFILQAIGGPTQVFDSHGRLAGGGLWPSLPGRSTLDAITSLVSGDLLVCGGLLPADFGIGTGRRGCRRGHLLRYNLERNGPGTGQFSLAGQFDGSLADGLVGPVGNLGKIRLINRVVFAVDRDDSGLALLASPGHVLDRDFLGSLDVDGFLDSCRHDSGRCEGQGGH